MQGIKTCMLNMKKEREIANDKADAVDAVFKVAETRLNKVQKEHNELTEECQKLEAEFKECQAEFRRVDKLVDKKDRDVTMTQLEANNKQKRIFEIDEECEAVEKKLKEQVDKLDSCNRRSDESGRLNRMMESRAKTDKLRFKELEKIIKDLTTRTEEKEMKIEENSQIIAMFEEDLETAENKANNSDFKICTLQEEHQVVGNNLKSLEVSAEQSRQAEIEFLRTIEDLNNRCAKMEARATQGENHVQRLLAEIDKLSGNMKTEQEKLRSISFEFEATLSEFK